jgi:FkbM family methyltransferase
VICFEPNPHIADMIEVNKTLNHRKNVKVIRAAVVEFPGKYKLSQIDGNVGAASLQPASGNDPTDQIVSTIAGTEVKTLLNGKRVGFIKVDTEGFESEVFSSLKELILTCQPVVAFEQQPTEIQGGTSKCIELLKTMGYEKIYVPVVSPNSRNPLLRTFKRIFLGRVTRYAERKRLDPDFYPLIIMMPKNA